MTALIIPLSLYKTSVRAAICSSIYGCRFTVILSESMSINIDFYKTNQILIKKKCIYKIRVFKFPSCAFLKPDES